VCFAITLFVIRVPIRTIFIFFVIGIPVVILWFFADERSKKQRVFAKIKSKQGNINRQLVRQRPYVVQWNAKTSKFLEDKDAAAIITFIIIIIVIESVVIFEIGQTELFFTLVQ